MSANLKQVPALVVGATGYVGGELLRLIAGHPALELSAATSDAQAGGSIAETFPHLATTIGDACFVPVADALARVAELPHAAVFCAAPHGRAAPVIDRLMAQSESSGCKLHLVDASADFRFDDAAAYAAVYGHEHPAPARLGAFFSGVPELSERTPDGPVGHPGCFATAMQLAIAPLLARGLAEPRVVACGITGATGSGKTPTATTHLPERHANLFAYKPLAHRHAPEVVAQLSRITGEPPTLHFIPHSGPFARGIHMTVTADARAGLDGDAARRAIVDFYAGKPFVQVVDGMPRLKSVVASNFAQIGVAVHGGAITVTAVLDNLMKGAAGGCMQWMNRLLGLPETTGLERSAPGWT